ncbi:helix-turn-helix transcriptional regulator [Mucilaginibacter psychrotolerans]|uniref:DNA-binding response regulator n=1 Tax=Mucilaginibacter psychrotolerans TaxID=1524096 RepID=A0A4Y8SKG4_9SPHI|nr:LuxR C-terminal-related transcriptional regulator [Mucilaginibacter psychrotolerans]TFF39573.1 DNA-binding response regulator [Mucilaginibacter psychrotolerans]
MSISFWARNRSVILHGVSLAALLLLMKWLEWQFIILDHAFEIYAGIVAFIFTGLGIWLALKLSKPKVITIEKQVIINTREFVFDENALAKTGMSRRELEVLELMAEGLSNQQIAEKLFVSLNTIKTHSSKVFEKLEVERRTQAIEKAKRLSLIH